MGDFDRVTFRWDGHISAALTNGSEVYLEGSCDACGQTALTRLDLGRIGAWLDDRADTPTVRVQ
jgi:hypothetical protein